MHPTELSKQIMYKIYDMVCIQKYTEEDMKDYLVYEGDNNPERIESIKQIIECCQHFLVECLLTQTTPPEPANVGFEITRIPDQIIPKVKITILE